MPSHLLKRETRGMYLYDPCARDVRGMGDGMQKRVSAGQHSGMRVQEHARTVEPKEGGNVDVPWGIYSIFLHMASKTRLEPCHTSYSRPRAGSNKTVTVETSDDRARHRAACIAQRLRVASPSGLFAGGSTHSKMNAVGKT